MKFWSKVIHQKFQSEFSRNVLTLVTGTTVAQAIPVLISPILTRLYSPEDFGIYAIYFSVLMILSVVGTGKYEMAIVLPKNDEDAKKLFVLSISIATAVSIFLLIAIAFSIYFLPIPESLVNAKSTFLLIPVGIFLIGLTQSLHYFLNRKGRYVDLAKARIFRSIGYVTSTITFGLINPLGFALALGDSIGYLANNLFLLFKENDLLKNLYTKAHDLKAIAKRYSNFPKYLIVSGLFEKGSGQAPVLLISNLFNSTIAAGYFSFAQRMIVTPADLVSRAISDVFRQRASQDFHNHGNCHSVFIATFKKLLMIGVLPFCLGYFIINDLFAFVFGSQWAVAGEFAQIMMPMFFLQFVVSPLSIVFVIAEKQKYDLLLQIFLFIAVVLSFVVGSYFFQDIRLSVKLFTFVYCLKYLVEFALAYKFSLGRD